MHAVYVDKEGSVKSWPAIYIAMDNKSETTYDFLLKLIKYIGKKHGFDIDPRFVITDFEQGEINALKHAFPNAWIIGCWFHYTQAIQAWFHKNTGHIIYNNLEANLIKSYLLLLPWIPVKFVKKFWEKYLIPQIKKIFNTEIATNLIKYMNNTWFSKYNIHDWNVFGKPIWTNNIIENTNKILNQVFGNHSSKIEFLRHVYDFNATKLDDWYKFMNFKKTYRPPTPWKKEKKTQFITISQKYWPQHIIDSTNPNTFNTIKYILNYLIEMNNIRIKYSYAFRNKNKTLDIPLTTEQFLAKKSLNNSKLKNKYCKKCEKQIDKTKFNDHQKTCTLMCTICTKLFITKKAFITHNKKHQFDEGKIYYCPYKGCSRKYKKKQTYNNHLKKCQIFTCEICINLKAKNIYTTRTKKLYDNHIIKHGTPTIPCNECGKLFHLNQDLKKHKKIHNAPKKFICVYCKKQFYTNNKLKYHQLKCETKKHYKFFESNL